MPVSRLPLQRVYAGSTSLFEYPIGPFLLFRALRFYRFCALRFLDADFFLPLLKACRSYWYFHALISVFPSSCVLTWPITFFLYVLLPGLTSCVSSASLPCLTVSPILSTWYFFTGLLSSDYSLSVWSALWCTFMICMRLRNPFIRYPLPWCPLRSLILRWHPDL